MLKVNRKVEYALVALKHMSAKPKSELTTVREICDIYGTPFDPLAHVLRVLNAEGVLNSEQGAYGGYRIAADLATINFSQFIQMIEGVVALTDCIKNNERNCTLADNCNILAPMTFINQRMKEMLAEISLNELVMPDSHWESRLKSPEMPKTPQPKTALA